MSAGLAIAAVFPKPTGASPADTGSLYAPELRRGVNLAETRTYMTCVKGTGSESKSSASSMNRAYFEHRIHNVSELHTALGISSSASAKFKWGSASGNFSRFAETSVSEEYVYWLVDVSYETTLESIGRAEGNVAETLELTDDAKQILANQGPVAFYRACGTHFYFGRQLGAQYSLLYRFSTRGGTSSVETSASGRGRVTGIAKAEASLRSLITASTQTEDMQVTSLILGGDNQVLNYARDLEQLEVELDKVARQLYVEKKGDVLRWKMVSYDGFKEVAEARQKHPEQNPVTDEIRNAKLAGLYELSVRNEQRIDSIRDRLVKSQGESPYYIYTDENSRALEKAIAELQRQNDRIGQIATSCIVSDAWEKECVGLSDIRQTLPKPDRDLTGVGKWQLLPVLESSSGPEAELYFVARYDGATGNHRIPTGGRLFGRADGTVWLRHSPVGGGPDQRVQVGTTERAFNREARMQPKICIGDFADICQLRMVDQPEAKFPDGSPATQAELTLFGIVGSQDRTYAFLLNL
jgi:hypothetical protein